MTLDVRQLLLSAASTGRNEEIRFLILEGGVDVNVESRSGTTALHYAAMQGKLETVRLLLSLGASINHKNSTGWTALHYSAHQGHADISRLLLDKGADLFAKRNDGKTPAQLMQVAQKTGGKSSSPPDHNQRDSVSKWHLCQALQNTKLAMDKLMEESELQKADMSKLWYENKATSKELERHMDQQRMDVVYLQEKLRGTEREMESIKKRLGQLEQDREREAVAAAAVEKSVPTSRLERHPSNHQPPQPSPPPSPPQFLLPGEQSRAYHNSEAGFRPVVVAQPKSLFHGANKTRSNLELEPQQQQFFDTKGAINNDNNTPRSNVEVFRVQSLPQGLTGVITPITSNLETQKRQPQPQPQLLHHQYQLQPQQQQQQHNFNGVMKPIMKVVQAVPRENNHVSKSTSASNKTHIEPAQEIQSRSHPLHPQQELQEVIKKSSNVQIFQPQLRQVQTSQIIHRKFSPRTKSTSMPQLSQLETQFQQIEAAKSGANMGQTHATTWKRVQQPDGSSNWVLVQEVGRAHSLSPQLLRPHRQPPIEIPNQQQLRYNVNLSRSKVTMKGVGLFDELRMRHQRWSPSLQQKQCKDDPPSCSENTKKGTAGLIDELRMRQQRLLARQKSNFKMQQQKQQQKPPQMQQQKQQQQQQPPQMQQQKQQTQPPQTIARSAYEQRDDDESNPSSRRRNKEKKQQQQQRKHRSKAESASRCHPKGWRLMKNVLHL